MKSVLCRHLWREAYEVIKAYGRGKKHIMDWSENLFDHKTYPLFVPFYIYAFSCINSLSSVTASCFNYHHLIILWSSPKWKLLEYLYIIKVIGLIRTRCTYIYIHVCIICVTNSDGVYDFHRNHSLDPDFSQLYFMFILYGTCYCYMYMHCRQCGI